MEMTLGFGGQTNQPNAQYVSFDTTTRSSIFTQQFPLPVGQSVTFKVKSQNASDSSVWIRACLYEVGVESIRDDLEDIIDDLTALFARSQVLVNTYDTTGAAGKGAGVIPTGQSTNIGIYPGTT